MGKKQACYKSVLKPCYYFFSMENRDIQDPPSEYLKFKIFYLAVFSQVKKNSVTHFTPEILAHNLANFQNSKFHSSLCE